MNVVITHLRTLLVEGDGASLTDGQLLECFVSRRDSAALEALVQRHAPMVWGVCRRVLPNYQDAEDAFQATFLVLVRKAASITTRELIANWIYAVATQTALKARTTAAKRWTRERQVTEMPEPAVADQACWPELRPLLDKELSRLPPKYRAVIVLCNLEGKSRKEAAQELGVPEGTIASRMASGRTLLAKRLARHGLAVSGGALAAGLTENVALAGVPISVVSSTIKVANLLAAGKTAGAISVKVIALTDGVINAMLITKLKTVGAALFLMLGIAVLGGGLFILQTEAAQKEKEKPAHDSPAESQVGAEEKKPAKPFTYQVITFVKNDPQTVCQGRMTADQFRKWFKSDYSVAGERVEIPGDATPFGALVLTGGDELIVLPLYTWQGEKVRHFACQGFKFGRAPSFSVWERSEEAFLRSMKERLAALE